MRISQSKLSTISSVGLLLAGNLFHATVTAQDRPVPDTYTALTTNMSPEGIELKADVLNWSDDEGRAAVIAALAADDPASALSELPSLGVVWRSGSAVGNAIKYADRMELPDGSQTVVLLTDKALGYTSFNPWSAGPATIDEQEPFSVVELHLNGSAGNVGTLSLAAEIVVDSAENRISLNPSDSAPMLLEDVQLEPKPYWISQNRDDG